MSTELFEKLKPITSLLLNPNVTEIMINGPQNIWFEQNGEVLLFTESFSSQLEYNHFIETLLEESKQELTYERPYLELSFYNFRLTLVSERLTKTSVYICIRRHPKNTWTLNKLIDSSWCLNLQKQKLKDLLIQKQSLLILGPTGSGKTSVISALLQELPQNERCILIEDTDELKIPNTNSLKLLTQEDFVGSLPTITQSDLVKKSLRLRPDRIIMGEIRGEEAKDYLMAISTGHRGSFGSIHAETPAQALLRLEMLIQMGAPQWELSAIRRLILSSLDYLIALDKNEKGQRFLKGIYKISSLEESGLLIDSVSTLSDPPVSGSSD